MEPKKGNILTDLWNGKLPSMDVNTAVTLDSNSLLNIGGVVFLAGFLIVVTWYVFRK